MRNIDQKNNHNNNTNTNNNNNNTTTPTKLPNRGDSTHEGIEFICNEIETLSAPMILGRSSSEREFGCRAQYALSFFFLCFLPFLFFPSLTSSPSRFISIRHFYISPPPLNTCEYKTILQPGLLLGENPDQFFSEKSDTPLLNTKSIYPIRKKFNEFSEACPMFSVRTKQRGVGEVKCLLNPVELTLEPEVNIVFIYCPIVRFDLFIPFPLIDFF